MKLAKTTKGVPLRTGTKILQCKKETLSKGELELCRKTIENGGLLIFPTDTVYGVGCNAFNPAAIQRVYALKGRHYSKPLPIFLEEESQLPLVAKEVLPETTRLMEAYWPGALTLVFKTAPMALFATRGRDTIAVRVPDHGVVKQLLQVAHLPLAATSANESGKKSLIEGRDVIKLFNGKVDIIIDGGRCEWAQESSVVDATHFPFTVIREAAISRQDLAKRLNLV